MLDEHAPSRVETTSSGVEESSKTGMGSKKPRGLSSMFPLYWPKSYDRMKPHLLQR